MEAPAESLTRRATRAAQWRFAGSVIGAALQFAASVILARLLTPRDFGTVMLASLVLGLAQLLGHLGIGSAVIQRPVLTERHVQTAFTLSVLVGVATASLIVAIAPIVAAVMTEPILIPILRTLSLSFVLGGVSTVAGALLRRSLDFKKQCLVEIGSYVVGYGVATSLAILDYGPWSLVYGGLSQACLATMALMALVRHSLRPLLGRSELRDLFGYGIGATLSGVVNYVALNGDSFIVGRWNGLASLGLYSRAYSLMNTPFTHVSRVMSSVLFPALAKVQTEPERMRRAYLLVTQLTAMVAGPVMAVMAVTAPHLVTTLYGPQWLGTVLPLQILCGASYFRALYHLGGIVAHSAGRVYSELLCQVIYATLVIVGAMIGSRHGLPGVAAGVAMAILYMFVTIGQLALRITGTTWRLYFRVQVYAMLVTIVTAATAMVILRLLEAVDASSAVILIAVVTGSALTWGVGFVWRLGEPDFLEIRNILPLCFLHVVERIGQLRVFSRGPSVR